MSFKQSRTSFYYGAHADMQVNFLATMDDEAAADAVAEVLARFGEALDTGDLTGVRDVIDANQVAAYLGDDEPGIKRASPTARYASTP